MDFWYVVQQPRGKQRWLPESYGCFYVQTTGIWKTVWSEYVPLEMQDVIVLFQPSRVHLDAPSVPDIAVGSLLFYAAELRLIGEGHLYPQAAGEFLLCKGRAR